MSIVEDVKDKLDIVDVIGARVPLKKEGRNFKGLCPFHQEKTASFIVFPETQTWHCFGSCNAGGDVIDFVMRSNGMDFRAALVELARQAGVTLTGFGDKERQALELKRGREAVFTAAARYFVGLMGKGGQEYARRRGWTDETIKTEGLGYYDGNAGALRKALEEAGCDVNAPAAQAVLKMPPGVLVYPHKVMGKVGYLSVRGIGEDKKHWNLPGDLAGERQVYFNGIYRRDARQVIIVEGQANAVTLAQWGFAAVALAGCSADDGLVEALKKRHAVLFLGYDADEPGQKALNENALRWGPLARVLAWPVKPPRKDCNDWLQTGGTGEECRALLKGAPTWLDVLVERAGGCDDGDELEHDEAVRAMFEAAAYLSQFELSKKRKGLADRLGIDLQAFDAMLKVVRRELGQDENGRKLYEVVGNQTYYKVYDTLGNDKTVLLAHFCARIVSDVVEDDGEEQIRRFEIEGKYPGGTLARIEVEAGEFAQMAWPLPRWGTRAAVAAGSATKDHLRAAILALSRDVDTRYDYSHMGWRSINGKMVYLSSNGAIGMDNVHVKAAHDLGAYKLPGAPVNVREAMEASLRFLQVGNYTATVPLWACVFLAPLASIIPPTFTVWIHGTTGSLKSTACALAMCHYGKFAYNTPPASWTGTENALEKLAFLLKDMPLWIDDYTVQATMGGNNEMRRKTDRLLRDWGNRAGRSRMRSDLTMRQVFVPRGLIISTAEILPPGQSILSRLFAVEFNPEMVTRGNGSPLSLAQEADAPLYPHAMAGYVLWLAERYKQLQEELPGRLRAYTEDARAKGTHLRMPGNIAEMFIGFEMGMEYAVHVGATTAEAADEMLTTAWETLLAIGAKQHEAVIEENPVDMYVGAIQQMLATGACYLRSRTMPDSQALVLPASAGAGPLQADKMIGWYDDKFYYLLPKAAYNAVFGFYRDGGIVFPDTERGVRAKLKERGLSITSQGRLAYQVSIGGALMNVLCIGRADGMDLVQESIVLS